MSTSPETNKPDFELDLDLTFLPAWAQQPADKNKYSKYTGTEESGGGSRREGGFRNDRGSAPRRDGGFRNDRGSAPRRDGPPAADRGPRIQPAFGSDRGPRREGGFSNDRGPRRDSFPERREPLPPPLPFDVSFIPEDKGVESLARQIRLTGRAYPLFDIAHLVLKKVDRYRIQINALQRRVEKPRPQEEGASISESTPTPQEPPANLFICSLDDTLWLSEADAVEHALGNHFATFYSSEKLPTDAPKGVYTFVAQCSVSGVILGPPNYHDYQNKLRKLHTERFARMPFEAFKSRIKIVKDEEVVKKWVEEQSFRIEFTALNIPEEVKLGSMSEVQQHFRSTHASNVIKIADKHTILGSNISNQPCRPLQAMIRHSLDDQTRFPIKIVNHLSQQFARQGLQFFKVNKTVTHVAVARPNFLDMEATPVSDGMRKIVDLINATPKCTRRKLIEAFEPTATAVVATPSSEAESVTATPVSDATPPSPEMAALVSNLHWLVHQGHVIEFATGLIETAKRPLIKPITRPEPKAAVSKKVPVVTKESTDVVATESVEVSPVVESTPEPATPEPSETPTTQGD